MEYHSKNISKETILFLQHVESEFNERGNKLLRQKEHEHLETEYTLSIEDTIANTPFHRIESNANFDLEGSYSLYSLLNDYLSGKRGELAKFLQHTQQLLVRMNFKRKEEKKNPEENLPYFAPIHPRYKLSQMILPSHLKRQIEEALSIIKYQNLIYHQWGFEEIDSIPKSILNFYGPPGTGKTMCAHAVAHDMGKKLLALNYADIESKYVGEAPKNLKRAFDIAKDEDCVLFFDEADSVLGKRITNVTQGSEQALNSLRSQMLILLEEFNGIVIFATNLVSNFDSAFESRILKHLLFELPNEKARINMIRKMIPGKLPMKAALTNEELQTLSLLSEGFSGREIKNAILETLLSKAVSGQENITFSATDFKACFTLKQQQYRTLRTEKATQKQKQRPKKEAE